MTDESINEGSYKNEYRFLALIVSALIILGGFWLWSTLKLNPTVVETTSELVATTTARASDSGTSGVAEGESSNGLIIDDQKAGLEVFITSAKVASTNWIVIREDREGSLGNALGAARFGKKETGTVELLRGTTPGNIYYGLVYLDDGDRIFSMERDVPILGSTGKPILTPFKTY